MSALTLVPTAAPPCPVVAGDRLDVPEPIGQPSGRVLRTGGYEALRVETTPPEHAHLGRYRVIVLARLDCSRLPKRFHAPTPEERRDGAEVPLAAQAAEVALYPGDFTLFRGGEIATLPDHPLQTS